MISWDHSWEVILSRDKDGCTPNNAYPLYVAGVFFGILGDYDQWPYTHTHTK